MLFAETPPPADRPHQAATPDAIEQLIRIRRTIHEFVPDALPDEDLIDKALELATWAPNHYLSQPWRFYKVGPETKEALCQYLYDTVAADKGESVAKIKATRWRAIPGWLLVTSARNDNPIRQQEDYAACCAGMQNALLYLASAQVGTKWSTPSILQDAAVYDLVGIDAAAEQFVGIFWYGYPKEILVTKRKQLSDVLTRLP